MPCTGCVLIVSRLLSTAISIPLAYCAFMPTPNVSSVYTSLVLQVIVIRIYIVADPRHASVLASMFVFSLMGIQMYAAVTFR